MLGALTAATSITSGVGLVAFVAVAILVAYLAKLKARSRAINEAPPGQKADVIELTAQDFGVSLSGLTRDQQFDLVVRIINSRRFYAIAALFVAIMIAIVAALSILYQDPRRRENVGPVRLEPGETRSINVNLVRSRSVDVTVQNISADWSRNSKKLDQWTAQGRGSTPEIWFSLCSGGGPETCREHGIQRGINGSYRKELSSGPVTVTFFNFRDNPPVNLTATIEY